MTSVTDHWSAGEIWFIIATLGVATYLIRLSFLGLIGNRALPAWLLRHLRYTPVAILPALVTPLVVWPTTTEGALSPPHLVGAIAAMSVGYWRKSPIWAVVAGMVSFLIVRAVF
ncbi:AzlD domain-containing protein [Jannaschia sp. CCS1]|uniref:AzlD domain-containing protein n=1 Tax=Jannaschia sp. (strain CCS1) TaxID=290400 RepID=UPI000053B3EC|nr:AzlD domain-containing protein [Jannaschia sp. CCS1]ABD53377.1 branched-chain amino acid transport [Jannaschia sp. CCS1]